MSSSRNFILCIIVTSIATTSLMYAPQPIIPTLAEYFHVPIHSASLIISFALLPLAIAPIIYGYLLEKFSAKTIIVVSLFACFILQFFSCFTYNFHLFLILRVIEALFFPAILTSLLTLATRCKYLSVQKSVSLYVGATIGGGLVGRIGGSFFTEILSWQWSFAIFGCCIFLCGIWFIFLKNIPGKHLHNITVKNFIPFLKRKRFLLIFGSIFFMFFAFQAILATLPFAFKYEGESKSDFEIGLLYTGYIMGIMVSFFASRIAELFNGRINAIIVGFLIFGFSIIAMSSLEFVIIFLFMFLFCIGSFTIHSLSSALLNSLSNRQKGITNGLYLAFYYSGGVIGSYLPSFYYTMFGWKSLTLITGGIMFCIGILLFYNRHLYEDL